MSVLQSFLAGKEARRQQDAEDRMSAQRDYLFQNSEGIMSGDKGALGGLARFDPMMALSIDSTHQANRRQDAIAARAAAAERRAQQAFDANMSAAEAAEAAAELERGIQVGLATQSPEQWDTLMGQNEETQQFVGQFENREQIAQGLLPIVEQLKLRAAPQPNFERVGGSFVDMNNPAAGAQPIPNLPAPETTFRAATPEEAASYGAQAGQVGPDGRFYPINPPSGMELETTPEGGVRLVQGSGAGSSSKLTELQSKDNVYATRAQGAMAVLDGVGAEVLSSRSDVMLDAVPLGIGREIQDEDFQVAQQAGTEFLQAILRKDTGAAITAQEQVEYGKTYLPQPGDGPQVIEAKKEARARALAALKSGMSAEQILTVERTLSGATGEQPSVGGSLDSLETAPEISRLLEKYGG